MEDEKPTPDETVGDEEPEAGVETSTDRTDWQKRYKDTQSAFTKVNTVSKRMSEQLTAAGYMIEDDGTIYAPPPAETREEEAAPGFESEEDRWTRLEAQVQSLGGVTDAMTTTAAMRAKASVLDRLPEDVREEASAVFDKQVKGLSPQQRVDNNVLDLISDAIVGRAVRMGAAVKPGRSKAATRLLGTLAGSSETPGGDSTPSVPTLDADGEAMYNKLGLQSEGITKEEYAQQIAQRRQRRNA